MSAAAPPARQSFAALRVRGYRAHFATYVLAMMADNIEHVISYWVVFQKFHSPALGGFAVLSHWLPFLLLSVPAGALAERMDPRRMIQIGMGMFIVASLGWGWFFITDTLQVWHAMVLLVLHGCAGVMWQTPSQLLLHDIVEPDKLQSAVRLNATARYLGILVGPAAGGLIMLTLGPSHGILVNTLFYLPLMFWLWKAPYGWAARGVQAQAKRAVRGLADIVQTARDIAGRRVIVTMTVLMGAASFFVGNSYHAQMPAYAADLGHGDPGLLYSLLLAADAGGALLAGVVLEGRGLLQPHPRTALVLALLWAIALACFAAVSWFPLALVLLFLAGFFELSFGSMAQALVQGDAPPEMRGRVIGLFNMASLGLRAFSGITVGLMGSLLGVHWSLGLSAVVLAAVVSALLWRLPAAPPPPPRRSLTQGFWPVAKMSAMNFDDDFKHLNVRVSELLTATADSADADIDHAVPEVLRLMRERLNMDVVFVSEFVDGHRVMRYVDRKDDAPALSTGDSGPLETSYCQRVVDGRMPELVTDVAKLPASVDLPKVPLRIGAHLSTPITLPDGHTYGTLCCFSRAPNEQLRKRDLEQLKMTAQLVARKIDSSMQRHEPPDWSLAPVEPTRYRR